MCIKSLVIDRYSSFPFFSKIVFSLGGGTCYDLINAYACFCPDRVFRPQCNNTSPPSTGSVAVLMGNSNRKWQVMIDICLRWISLAKVSGNRVEKPISNDCLCRNGGICHSKSSGSGKLCQCPTGFTGPFCETTICKLREFNSSNDKRLNKFLQRIVWILVNNIAVNQPVKMVLHVKSKDRTHFASVNQVLLVNDVKMVRMRSDFIYQRISFLSLEYFRCQGNGRFADVSSCRQGRYFECVYFGQRE